MTLLLNRRNSFDDQRNSVLKFSKVNQDLKELSLFFFTQLLKEPYSLYKRHYLSTNGQEVLQRETSLLLYVLSGVHRPLLQRKTFKGYRMTLTELIPSDTFRWKYTLSINAESLAVPCYS